MSKSKKTVESNTSQNTKLYCLMKESSGVSIVELEVDLASGVIVKATKVSEPDVTDISIAKLGVLFRKD